MENSTFSRNGNNLATCDQPQELFQTEHAGDLGTVNTKIRRVIHVKLSFRPTQQRLAPPLKPQQPRQPAQPKRPLRGILRYLPFLLGLSTTVLSQTGAHEETGNSALLGLLLYRCPMIAQIK